jgi:hypothetical protein
LGIQLALLRVLGTIPAPVLFGKLMDLACSLWETIPDKEAQCSLGGSTGDFVAQAGDEAFKYGSCRAYYNGRMST